MNVQQEGAVTVDRRGGGKPKKARDYVADHARRTLRALGLTKEQASNVVKALSMPGADILALREGPRSSDGSFDLSKMSRGLPQGMTKGQLLGRTFSWYDAAEKLGLDSDYFCNLHTAHSDYGHDAGVAP